MNRSAWNRFVKARERFRYETEELARLLPKLKIIQQKLADGRATNSRATDNRATKNSLYVVQTPVVYNSALDDVTSDDEIKLILVADNPGRREQEAKNRRYLVGPSGKIAQKFFRENPALGIDFFKNVIILNKTPIHSPRTADLRELCRIEEETGSRALAPALEESQRTMAALLLDFHEALQTPVWIIGYSEMRRGGIFEVYTERLKSLYADKKEMYKQIYFYRHFSMNQFTIDLKKQSLPEENTAKSLKRIGEEYRQRILEG